MSSPTPENPNAVGHIPAAPNPGLATFTAAAPYGSPSTFPPPAPYFPTRTNGLAIAALVSSFFVSLLGVILGHIALKQIRTTGESGRGLAIAGLAIGYAGLAAGVLCFAFVVGVTAIAGS